MNHYYLLKKGEFAYNKSYSKGYPVGSIKRLDEHEKGALSTLYICFSLQDNVSSDYIKNYFDSDVWHKEIFKISAEGARNHGLLNVPPEAFFNTSHRIPKTIDEQKQIAIFLNKINDLITLHNKKLELLKKYKRGLIFQLYPQKDQSFPKIRIKGFKDPWTKVRLCDVLDEFVIKSSKENEYVVLSSTNDGMEYRQGRVSGASNKGYKIIDINDLVFSPQNLWLGNININHLAKGIVSPSYKTYKIHDIDIDFLEPILHTKAMLNNYAQSSVQGASVVRRNLDINLFNSIEINVPSKKEQHAIGELLKKLDRIISDAETQYSLLQQYKRGLLSNMFI